VVKFDQSETRIVWVVNVLSNIHEMRNYCKGPSCKLWLQLALWFPRGEA